MAKKHSEFATRRGATECVVQHGLHQQRQQFADEAHVPGACPRANRRTDHRGASATVDSGRDRRKDEAANSISPIQQNSMKNGYDENNGYDEER